MHRTRFCDQVSKHKSTTDYISNQALLPKFSSMTPEISLRCYIIYMTFNRYKPNTQTIKPRSIVIITHEKYFP